MNELKVALHPEADKEILEALRFYRDRKPGLDSRLLSEIEQLKAKLLKQPRRCGFIEEPLRCCRLARFPFGLVYHVTEAEIFIVALMHWKRRPGYWKSRLPETPAL